MSWSIVRTCRRCSARCERPIVSRDEIAATVHALVHHFNHPESDDGCPACDPKLAEDARQQGIDLDGYNAGVDLARRHRGS